MKSKLMSMYLPKRLELWLRLVRAFPKASSTQVDLSNTSLTLQEGTGWGYNVKTSSRGLSSSLSHALSFPLQAVDSPSP